MQLLRNERVISIRTCKGSGKSIQAISNPIDLFSLGCRAKCPSGLKGALGAQEGSRSGGMLGHGGGMLGHGPVGAAEREQPGHPRAAMENPMESPALPHFGLLGSNPKSFEMPLRCPGAQGDALSCPSDLWSLAKSPMGLLLGSFNL